MSTPAVDGAPPVFEHTALLYAGDTGFLAGVLPFVRAGVDRGEATMVVVQAPRIDALRRALGRQAGLVDFVDMAGAGRNPTRIIGLWQDFLDMHEGDGTVRGVGEPVWADRDPDELVECRNHEALLNVAFAGAPPWRLLCPYDTSTLPGAALAGACDTHPLVQGGHSTMDAGGDDPLLSPLADPPESAAVVPFDRGSLGTVRATVSRAGARAGLRSARISDLVLAVDEVAANSVRHGGGAGVLHVWNETAGVVCSVSDRGRIPSAMTGRTRPRPGSDGGAGLWLVNQVCDLVQVRSTPSGSVVRVRMGRD